MHYYSENEVRQLLQPVALIGAIREAFARDFHKTLRMPVRTHMQLSESVLLLMPCYDSSLNIAGVKMVTVSGQSGVNATYSLLDPASGAMLAMMDANYLTDIRTAATSAVATDLLARKNAATLAVFGSGRQAVAHLALLPCVRKFQQILVCGSGRSDLENFRVRMKLEYGIEITLADAERCAREADVICTCTSCSQPLFDGRWLRPGTHLNLVGAFQPHTQEVDDETVRRSRIIVDTFEGALAEAGDLLIPIANGTIDRNSIVADLHELASGSKQGRNSDEEITLFKSVGCALEDLVTAQLIWKKHEEQRAADHADQR
jgi:ornithine cyclodeaminase/alanine dehydrogenase-like protein (mu-crystallin family)